MTYEEFLRELRKVPDLSMTRAGQLRAKRWCPVTVVAFNLTGHDDGLDYSTAAQRIGLDWTLARKIALAADIPGDFSLWGPWFRRRHIRHDLVHAMNIGKKQREIVLTPREEPVPGPIKMPEPQKAPDKEREREKVPAGR